MNGRTLVSGVCCFLKKYSKIVIHGVIDYIVFRYRLNLRDTFIERIFFGSHRADSDTCKQTYVCQILRKLLFYYKSHVIYLVHLLELRDNDV